MTATHPETDVSALLLTIDEPTTERAREALENQQHPVREIVVVRNVAPFVKAFSQGVAQVSSPYFVQVDADMILDADAVATLRRAMQPSVGIVVGRLRDALMGQVVGVKLFRTACFENHEFVDSISPDTDFVASIAEAGWRTIYVGRTGEHSWLPLGDHQPNYDGPYTYRKFLLEGQRYVHRKAPSGLIWQSERLAISKHSAAVIASVALARGVFRNDGRDALGLMIGDEEYAQLARFLAEVTDAFDSTSETTNGELGEGEVPLRTRFNRVHEMGRKCFQDWNPLSFAQLLGSFSKPGQSRLGALLRLGLCRGLLNDGQDEGSDFELASAFLFGDSAIGSAASRQEATYTSDLQDLLEYSADLGLDRFAAPLPVGTEFYRVLGSGAYARGAQVCERIDQAGRPRIAAPPVRRGHVMCVDPQRVEGIAWCADLLRSGYRVAHIPTEYGAFCTPLLGALAGNVLRRIVRRNDADARAVSPRTIGEVLSSGQTGYHPTSGVILMVTEGIHRGGSERQLLAVAEGLVRRGFDLRLLCLTRLDEAEPSYEYEFRELGVIPSYAHQVAATRHKRFKRPIAGLHPDVAASLPTWLRNRLAVISLAIEKERPEIVHTRQDVPGVSAAIAAVRAGVPNILLQQGSMAYFRRGHPNTDTLRTAYRQLANNPAVRIVNNSEAGARDNDDWIGLRKGTVGVLYNGLSPDTVRRVGASEAIAVRDKLGIPAADFVVGTIMRFAAVKDPGLWIETIALVAKARSDVSFIIGGHGPLERDMKSRIDGAGLGDRVHLIGAVTDVGLAYSAMDVVLMTSSLEGLPNVLIEAQSIGRAVVAPDVGGCAEAVSEGVTGIIARPRSAAALSEAVLAILADSGFRARAGVEGPRLVAKRFAVDRMVEETIRAYGRSP